MDEEAWREVGRRVQEARNRRGLSMRKAAAAAGMSEGYWRQLERGGRSAQGQWLLPTHSSAKIAAAARCVGLDPATLLAVLGRPAPETRAPLAKPTDPPTLYEILLEIRRLAALAESHLVEEVARVEPLVWPELSSPPRAGEGPG